MIWKPKDVGLWGFGKLAETTAPSNTDVMEFGAEVVVARGAEWAPPAAQQRLHGNPVTWLYPIDIGSDCDDFPAEFVSENFADDPGHEFRHCARAKVKITAANPRDGVADENLAGTQDGIGHLLDFHGVGSNEDRGPHLVRSFLN